MHIAQSSGGVKRNFSALFFKKIGREFFRKGYTPFRLTGGGVAGRVKLMASKTGDVGSGREKRMEAVGWWRVDGLVGVGALWGVWGNAGF